MFFKYTKNKKLCLIIFIFPKYSECNKWFRFATINLFQQQKYSNYKKSFEDCCFINTYKILEDALDQVFPKGRHNGKIYCTGSMIIADQCHQQLKPLNIIIKKGRIKVYNIPKTL